MKECQKSVISVGGLGRVGLMVWVMLCLTLVTTSPAAATGAAAPPQEASAELSSEAEQAAYLINKLRMEAGLPPLTVHPLLTLAANLHIQDMINTGHWGHSGSDGSNVRQRITRTGYQIDGWAGENWAVYETVETSINWWMTDPPHRDNVLNRSYKEMGIGTHPHPRGWGLILVVDFTTGSTNQGGGAVIAPASVAPPPPPAPVVPVDGATYTVQSGDTLSSIGQRHGLSWQAIASANGLGEFSVLQVGNQIVLPGVNDVTVGGTLTQASAPAVANQDRIYTVVEGDTVFEIAMRYGVNWQTLSAYNNLPENAILSIGTQLKIPTAYTDVGEAIPTSPPPAMRVHVVQEGETLWSIAARNSVDWYELMRVNGFDENSVLSIGQEISLP